MTTIYVTLPTGKKIGIGAYVKAWKAIKTMPPSANINGWNWFPTEACRVLEALRAGIDDRINTRGAVDTAYKELNMNRVRRGLACTVKCECRWCGSALAAYATPERRFCSGECRRDYYA